MSLSVLGLPSRSTESVSVVSVSPPTYVRTYGLTKNLQDLGDSLTFLNAHEKSAETMTIPTLTREDTP